MQVYKKCIYSSFIFFIASSIFAQSSFSGIDSVTFPTVSSVTSPTMPTISSPTIGGGFYVPFFQNQKTNSKTINNSKREDKNQIYQQKEKKNIPTQKISSSITADEIYALSSMGLLENITGSVGAKNTYSTQTTTETKVILEKVLNGIEEIKNNVKEIPSVQPVTVVTSSPVVSSNNLSSAVEKASSRILRFNVNNYDILKTCKKIYISDVQHDGSFLVTGDRLYMSDKKNRTETFHMLFKNSSGENSAINYNAAATVTQDYLNENSFLYQLSKRNQLDRKSVV